MASLHGISFVFVPLHVAEPLTDIQVIFTLSICKAISKFRSNMHFTAQSAVNDCRHGVSISTLILS